MGSARPSSIEPTVEPEPDRLDGETAALVQPQRGGAVPLRDDGELRQAAVGRPPDRSVDERLAQSGAAGGLGDGEEAGRALPVALMDGEVAGRMAVVLGNEHLGCPALGAALDPDVVEVVAALAREA